MRGGIAKTVMLVWVSLSTTTTAKRPCRSRPEKFIETENSHAKSSPTKLPTMTLKFKIIKTVQKRQ